MQLQVNITPSVTLLLVRRVTCRALIGRKTATSHPAILRTVICSFGSLIYSYINL